MSVWVPSPNYYKGRKAPIRWIVWHSTESNEVAGGAHSVAANWFGLKASRVSAHIVADDGSDPRYPDGIVECVRPRDTAWHASKANTCGYGVEIVGRAGQGQGWDDTYSRKAVANACKWINAHPALDGIPARWLTDAQLRDNELGHVTHAQVSRVFGGTHTDPGAGFERDYVMACLGADPIAALQGELNRLFPTYSKLVVDGVYGPATEAVIREFQRRTGLEADGVIGPMTRRELAKFGITV